MRRRTTGSTRCCGRASPSSCSNGWSGCTTPFVAQRGLAYLFSGRGLVDLLSATAVPVAIILGVQSRDRLAARCSLDTEGGSRDTGVAAAAPGAGGGIRVVAERAGDLPDGVVALLGGDALAGTRRPAGSLRQRAGGAVVGGDHPDHGRLWRRGAGHGHRPAARGLRDDLRARRVRAVDRHSGHRLCRRNPPRQFFENLGSR